jgi:hypothetical protein
MKVSQRIYEEVKKLPEPLQVEVLDFVHALASKTEQQGTPENEINSTRLSLSLAMRGMEDEDTPSYSINDLTEAFP